MSFGSQVLSPVKAGPLGTRHLNQVLQPIMNHHARARREHLDKQRSIRGEIGGVVMKGDRVIQLVNDYESGVFNGDSGTVFHAFAVSILSTAPRSPGSGSHGPSASQNGSFTVLFESAQNHGGIVPTAELLHQYNSGDLNQRVALSYALTVHKAQGSE